MSKLTSAQKELRKELRAKFTDVRFAACKVSGVTVMTCKHPGGNFHRVAVAYCGSQDTFNRKRGEYEALVKMDVEQFILMPSEWLETLIAQWVPTTK